MEQWNCRFVSGIDEIGRETWNRLCGTDYPFLRYEFLAALEHSGCVSEPAGWVPHHLVVETGGETRAVMPVYRKFHSWGEYVFDWAWADAYHRYGRPYYPKLLTAIPFTPATGPRLGCTPEIGLETLMPAVVRAIQQETETGGASSWHCLFPMADMSQALEAQQIATRYSCQYHWLNNDYASFDDFLSGFVSRKRKNLKKERRRVAEQDIELVRKCGEEITETEWYRFFQFYHLTYLKRSGRQGYLNRDFFERLAQGMGDNIMMATAYYDGEMIAAALFFYDSKTLYGRYWGCAAEFDFLHFEACYYQGIEFAIERGLKRFDPGAQGEHKIQRGFTPVITYSNHYIADPVFRDAVEDFLQREGPAVEEFREDAHTLLPFKGR